MSIGDSYEIGVVSSAALFKESTFGVFPASAGTGASSIEALSIGFKVEIESQKLDMISNNRGYTKRVQLNKMVEGTLEQYLHPVESVLPVAAALGGGIVSASLSGGFIHSLTSGNFDTAPTSLAFQVRKGSTHHFRYTGGRVNVLTISAKIGEPVSASYEFVFQDATQAGSDISGLCVSSVLPFTYVDGTYMYASSEAGLTTTAAEKITGFELEINNNLKSDDDVRSLGTNVISNLPPTRREVNFKITQRFDTLTAWNRFTQATIGSAELKFVGASISTKQNYSCVIIMPKLYLNTPDVEITSPNDLLMSEIEFDVLVDNPCTTTGRDIGFTFINNTQSY